MFAFIVFIAFLSGCVDCRPLPTTAQASLSAILSAPTSDFRQKSNVVLVIKQEQDASSDEKNIETFSPELFSLVNTLQTSGQVETQSAPILVATVFEETNQELGKLLNDYGNKFAQAVSVSDTDMANIQLYHMSGDMSDLSTAADAAIRPTVLTEYLIISLSDSTVTFIGEDSQINSVSPGVVTCRAVIYIVQNNSAILISQPSPQNI